MRIVTGNGGPRRPRMRVVHRPALRDLVIGLNGLSVTTGDSLVVSANIHGGLAHQLDELMQQRFAVMAIQEADVDEREVPVLRARAIKALFFLGIWCSHCASVQEGLPYWQKGCVAVATSPHLGDRWMSRHGRGRLVFGSKRALARAAH